MAGWRNLGKGKAILTAGADHQKKTWVIPRHPQSKPEPDPFPWNPSHQTTPKPWVGAKGGSLLHIMHCEEAPGGWRQALNGDRQRKHGSQ